MEKQWKEYQTSFSWAPKWLQMVSVARKLKDASPWKKRYDQSRQHMKKQRHYFPDKGPSSHSYGFSSSHVRMESWTVKRAEQRRNDAFELGTWRRLLTASWSSRRWNQFILKEISPEHKLEGLMLELKLQYIGHLMRKTDSLEKSQMPGNFDCSIPSGW